MRYFGRFEGRRLAASLPLIIVSLALLTSGEASAHAFLDESDPSANSVMEQPPDEVRIRFTEPVEPDYTGASLFDANGARIQTEPGRIGDESNQIILPLPPDLPRGTYTVQWNNVSAADGHPQTGYIPFTVGAPADVATPAPPEITPNQGPPAWVKATGNWLSLMGITGAIGGIITWLWVIRPGISHFDADRRQHLGRHTRSLVLGSVAVALAGSLLSLGVQVSTTGGSVSFPNTLDVLFDTRYGYLWLARAALLLMLAAVSNDRSLWRDQPSGRTVALALVVAAAAPVPFSLISHASAETVGRMAALAADWLHIVAASVWVGGLLALVGGLVYAGRGVSARQRTETFARVIPRFSTLAISSVIILTLTGFYASWLHVGNLTALQETSYGQTLLVKLGLTLLLLAFGALHLFVAGPRMRSAVNHGTRFGRTITAEAALGIAVLFTVGLLISLPTARQTIAAETGKTRFHLSEGDVHATLYLSPGAVGTNRYTADISLNDGELSSGTEVLLRTSRQSGVEGVRQVVLMPGEEKGRFEASGSELSVVGGWQLELILRRPNVADWRVTTPVQIGETPPEQRVPGPAPHFTGTEAGVGILLAGVSVVMLVVGLRRSGTPSPSRFLALLGAGFALVSLITLFSTEVTTPAGKVGGESPIPMSAEPVAAGRQLYLGNCAGRHGENANGNRADAAGMDPLPTDLHAAHVDDHPDAQVYHWINNGISGSAMPGFEDMLTGRQMWRLVNYVRSLRRPVEANAP